MVSSNVPPVCFSTEVDGVIIQEAVTKSNPQVVEEEEGRGEIGWRILPLSRGFSCVGRGRKGKRSKRSQRRKGQEGL